MRKGTAAWLAWALWAPSVASAIAATIFVVLDWSARREAQPNFSIVDALFNVMPLAFSTLGALIASRHHKNPIGWIFCIIGFNFALVSFADGYGVHTLYAVPGSLPAGSFLAWFSVWMGGPTSLIPFVLLFLLFPNGRLLSPRWRILAWLLVPIFVALLFQAIVTPGPLLQYPSVVNPFGIDALGRLAERVEGTATLLLLASGLAAALSMILRFRRSTGEERQQLKWFVSANALLAVVMASGPIFWFGLIPGIGPLWPVVAFLAFISVPVASTIAIFRYRLYNIDVIINRTLVYGTLTAVLALTYFGSVVLLQQLLRELTGQGNNQVAVVASTLAIYALFQPLRRRIQATIDRRFYRRKYDAARILTTFSAQLRDEVDLDTLTNDLLMVVEETLQPRHVSLWLRDGGRSVGEQQVEERGSPALS